MPYRGSMKDQHFKIGMSPWSRTLESRRSKKLRRSTKRTFLLIVANKEYASRRQDLGMSVATRVHFRLCYPEYCLQVVVEYASCQPLNVINSDHRLLWTHTMYSRVRVPYSICKKLLFDHNDIILCLLGFYHLSPSPSWRDLTSGCGIQTFFSLS